MNLEKLLMYKIGLDLGQKTCGIAISDNKLKIATPLLNFKYSNNNLMLIIHQLKKINLERDNNLDCFVLGYPTNPRDNSKVESTFRVERFKELLIKSFLEIPVYYQDENFSTKSASTYLFESGIKSAKRKKVIDMISAVVILQDFINNKN